MWAAFAAAGGPPIGGPGGLAARGGVAAVFLAAASVAAAAVVGAVVAVEWAFVAADRAGCGPEGVVRGEHHSLGRLVVVRFTGKRIGPGHDNRILDVRRIKLVKNVRNYESLL